MEQQDGAPEPTKLNFGEPISIDSSDYVMYFLAVDKTPGEDKVRYDEGGTSQGPYWNIVFYNTASGEYHLLDDQRKMIILSHHSSTADQGSTALAPEFTKGPQVAYHPADGLLFYTIATKDYNLDGELNSEDPHHLFISDRSGKRFKQISPDNESVKSWKAIEGTNKILISIIRDSNSDKKFDVQDVSVPLVYDLSKDKSSAEIFDEGFKSKLRKQFEEQWLKK